jgi:uncharacterized protein (TIGR00255 family)
MALQSMTGFARVEGADQTANWVWEMRSVNGKSLDLRFRLPPGLDAMERELKDIAAKSLSRGNIQVSLQLERDAGAVVPTLNENNLLAAQQIARRAARITGLKEPSIESLLQIRGVIEHLEADDDAEVQEMRRASLVESFVEAIRQLAANREQEGETIGTVLQDQISEIGRLTGAVRNEPSRSPAAISKRLAEQVSRLLSDSTGMDSQRLHQEAAILATKADLQEEIDRLESHVKMAESLIASGEAIGRKLDFLAQEFNRECNTICSKSNATAVTALGLEMKVVIDQFREQIQNLQ